MTDKIWAPCVEFFPRGIRNNNPGNIRRGSIWVGIVEGKGTEPWWDKDFVQFTMPNFGVRAMVKIIQTYRRKHKITTLEGIIGRWAPHSENPTDSLINFISWKIDRRGSDEIHEEDLGRLIPAMIEMENGFNPYDEADLEMWINDAILQRSV